MSVELFSALMWVAGIFIAYWLGMFVGYRLGEREGRIEGSYQDEGWGE